MVNYHSLDVKHVLNKLETSHDGLSPEEAENRLETYGKNELKEAKKRGIISMFLEQQRAAITEDIEYLNKYIIALQTP